MELWIARDRESYRHSLWLSTKEPTRVEEAGVFVMYGSDFMPLSEDAFPEVTWENSPRRVELKIVEE